MGDYCMAAVSTYISALCHQALADGMSRNRVHVYEKNSDLFRIHYKPLNQNMFQSFL